MFYIDLLPWKKKRWNLKITLEAGNQWDEPKLCKTLGSFPLGPSFPTLSEARRPGSFNVFFTSYYDDMIWNYMTLHVHIWLCYKMYIHVYLWSIYILMYAKPCCYICKPNKTSMFVFPSSSPQRLPLADISWWITWISSSATMRERPICSMGVWYFFTIRTCKPIKCKPFIVGFFIHLGYQDLISSESGSWNWLPFRK